MAYPTARRRNPALSAFLGQTPVNEGGMPSTAPPDELGADPMAAAGGGTGQPPTRITPNDPLQTALVADAQLRARQRRIFPSLSYFLR